jgi:pre-mRNA-processing factor 19
MASNSNATQTFTCALTGLTPLPPNDAVVTPSGYICSRKLLVTKLAENGGKDPFDTSRTLDESSLVDLNSSNNNSSAAAPPRPPTSTSLPSLLTQISSEFDTILLELYDTRKALEETRRELSSALYQNDAAVRVVARLVKERDEARGALEEFLANRGAVAPTTTEEGAATKKSEKRAAAPVEEDGPPSSKKPRSSASSSDDLSKIPQETLTIMTSTWEILSKNRRIIAKKSKRTKEQGDQQDQLLADALAGGGGVETKKVNVGKSTAKPGVLCISKISTSVHLNKGGGDNDEYIVSGGHDKQAIVYNVTSGQIVATLMGAGGDVIAVSGMVVTGKVMLVGTGSADGVVRLYSVPISGGSGSEEEVQLLGSEQLGGGEGVVPVSVVVHFSSTVEDATIIVGGSDGSVNVFQSSESGLKLITHLKSEDGIEFSSGCIHPDGLIYTAGTTTGKLIIYDLKTQAVAGTLQGHDGNPINCIGVSENGYHVATSSAAASSESPIHIWDLRKLKLSATITPPSDVGAVTSLAFDPMGLYLAYSGEESTKVCVVKDWDRVISTLSKTKTTGTKGKNAPAPTCGGVVWGGKGPEDDGGKVWIAAGCDGEKPIRFWGVE